MASSHPTQAQAQAQAVVPPTVTPPDCLLHVKLDVKCARATHDFLREIFPVPASQGRIFLLPGGQDQDQDQDQDENGQETQQADAVFVLPYAALRFTSSQSQGQGQGQGRQQRPGAQLAVLVDDVRQVRERLGRRGVRCREVAAGADGLGWVEFSDPDGYRWRVARLVWEGR